MSSIQPRPFFILFIIWIVFFDLPQAVIADQNDLPDKTIKGFTIISEAGESYESLKEGLSAILGTRFSAKAIKKSIEYLYQTGYFSNIIVTTDEGAKELFIKFTVVEKLRIGRIRWNGNQSFSNQKLEDISKLKADNELLPEWSEELQKRLTGFYQEEGYFNVKVNVLSQAPEKPNRIDIQVNIDEGIQNIIGNIYFTGDTGIDPGRLLESLRIHPGFYYSKLTVQNYINDLIPLYIRNKYLKVKIMNFVIHRNPPDKVDIEIPVAAGPQIFTHFSFKGRHHYLTTTLKNQTLIEIERSDDEATLDESKKRLIGFYQNEGYAFVEVNVERQEVSKGKAVHIYFLITEGPRVLLANVSFKGNASLPDKLLRERISQRETGFWIPRYLRLPAIQEDLQPLTSVYHSNGFLSSQIQETVIYSINNTLASLEFTISEGIRTYIHTVTFEGISQSYLSEVQKLVHTREKTYYNVSTILEDKVAVRAFYHRMGYADVKIDATAAFNETKDLVDIKYELDEGNIIKIGKIEAAGNERTHSGVILRELYFHSGDIYQEDFLLKSQRKISQLGIFQSVNIRPAEAEEENVIRDITVKVQERNAGAFEFGAGYADVERFLGFAEISHKNIAGTGRRASLRTDFSEIGNKEIANYTEPWIFDFPLDARASLYYESILKPPVYYTQNTLGGSVGVEKSFRDYYKLSLLYQYENVHYIDVPLNAQLIPEDRDRVNIASLNPALFRDTRDDFLNPTRGSFNAAWFRWAAQFMGSEIQEVKLTLQSSWFFDLGYHLVMGISGRSGIANNFGETTDVPLAERFKLGGRSTVRGYTEDTVGTLGQTLNPDFTPIGGNTMIVFNWELRYNLPKSFGLVLFFDSGNVWRHHNDFWSSPLKSSIGPGLRYNTPVGPLRLDIGYKLNREVGETASEFHFTLGHAF